MSQLHGCSLASRPQAGYSIWYLRGPILAQAFYAISAARSRYAAEVARLGVIGVRIVADIDACGSQLRGRGQARQRGGARSAESAPAP